MLLMAMMVAHTPTAAKAMSDEMVHFQATMLASVGPAKGDPKPKANCHPDSVIIHSEAEGRDGQGIYPSSRLCSI